jgi:hypothetical protein
MGMEHRSQGNYVIEIRWRFENLYFSILVNVDYNMTYLVTAVSPWTDRNQQL